MREAQVAVLVRHGSQLAALDVFVYQTRLASGAGLLGMLHADRGQG